MTNSQRQSLNKKIDEIADSLCDESAERTFQTQQLRIRLVHFLIENAGAFPIVDEFVQGQIKKWDEDKRPKVDYQGELFQPDALIPTGIEGQRVKMNDARIQHVRGWLAWEQKDMAKRLAAHDIKTKSINLWLNNWTSNCQTLGELLTKAA